MHPAEAALEYDRTKVAECVTRIQHTLGNYHWLLDGRGSYEWDDDRYRQEFKTACELLQKDLEPLVRIAADWSNCPQKWEDVQAARVLAATQEPAGSGASLLDMKPANRSLAEKAQDDLPGSPRKVGEDGAQLSDIRITVVLEDLDLMHSFIEWLSIAHKAKIAKISNDGVVTSAKEKPDREVFDIKAETLVAVAMATAPALTAEQCSDEIEIAITKAYRAGINSVPLGNMSRPSSVPVGEQK